MTDELRDNSNLPIPTKLADRVVPIPRGNGDTASLYALCRAWVRNNSSMPLVASDAQPHRQLGQGDMPPRQRRRPNADGQQGTQSRDPPQPGHDSQSSGLLSILPPLLPPTTLETDTAPPTYPLDDLEAQDAEIRHEDALRKFKQHWVAVRQYHQALRAAKLSRHRERLVALLGEPSLLQPPPGMGPPLPMPMQPPGLGLGIGLLSLGMGSNSQHALQQQQQLQQLQHFDMLGLTPQVMAEQMTEGGLPGLAELQAAGLGPTAGTGLGLGMGLQPSAAGFSVGRGEGGITAMEAAPGCGIVDAQAALATLLSLAPPMPAGAADAPGAQLSQLLLQQPLQPPAVPPSDEQQQQLQAARAEAEAAGFVPLHAVVMKTLHVAATVQAHNSEQAAIEQEPEEAASHHHNHHQLLLQRQQHILAGDLSSGFQDVMDIDSGPQPPS